VDGAVEFSPDAPVRRGIGDVLEFFRFEQPLDHRGVAVLQHFVIRRLEQPRKRVRMGGSPSNPGMESLPGGPTGSKPVLRFFAFLFANAGILTRPSASNASKQATHWLLFGPPAGVVHPISSHTVFAASCRDSPGYASATWRIVSMSDSVIVRPENTLSMSLLPPFRE
jgi:hypothetical protein